MQSYNQIIIPVGTDASVNQNSTAADLNQIYGFAITVVFTGTAAGTLKLQGSTDRGIPQTLSPLPVGIAGVTVWNDIAGSSQAITGAGDVTYNFNGVYYNWVRVVYTADSGTGTITATFNGKGN